MSFKWPWQKSQEQRDDLLQQKLRSISTMYANNYKEVGILDNFMMGGVYLDSKTGKPIGLESPKLLYAWLDPKAGMDENKAWLLLAIKGHFFELRVKVKETEKVPKIQPTGKAYSLKEFMERIELGDYDDMYNENTDKTVTQELKEAIKKYKLKN